jgi:capsular exopolysaccharide synthesis family protein
MSKIFDALQGTRSELSDLLPSLLGEPAGTPYRAPESPAPLATAGELAVEEPAVVLPGVEQRRMEERREFEPVPSGASAAKALTPEPREAPARIRRVPLVIASSEPLLPFENPQEPAAEQYRIARTKLAHHPKNPKMIVISSASSGDGKSFTAINLAGVLSLKGDTKVLLLDGDFRRSSMHSRLGLPPSPGLAEVITGECDFEDAVIQTDQFPNLYIIVRGNTGSINPSELLDSPRWHSLCKQARKDFDYIIIDSPPVAAVADFELIQIAADGTILVVRPEHSKRSACLQAIENIPKDKFLGVMLNCAADWFLSKRSSYGYGYGYTDNPMPARQSKSA